MCSNILKLKNIELFKLLNKNSGYKLTLKIIQNLSKKAIKLFKQNIDNLEYYNDFAYNKRIKIIKTILKKSKSESG